MYSAKERKGKEQQCREERNKDTSIAVLSVCTRLASKTARFQPAVPLAGI